MSTPLIVISSRTGNTRAVGHAICDDLPGARMINPDELPEDLSEFNPVLLGFWCDKWDAPEEIKAVAKRLENKQIGCFATLGGDPNDPKAKAWIAEVSQKLTDMGKNNTLIETFLCQGRISQEVFDRMTALLGQVTPEREQKLQASKTHPDRMDLSKAAEIFRSAFGMNF